MIMKWNLVTFSNEKYFDKQKYLEDYAKSLGMNVLSYTYDWFKKEKFFEENQDILKDELGLGYFLWKPYVIMDAINKMDEGDILFYADCGDIFHPEITLYVEDIIEDDPCLLVIGGSKNKNWTRRDCFVYMDCDEKDYWDSKQLESGVSFWRVCDRSKEIIAEWLKYCCDRRIISNDPNVSGKENFESFEEHRCDQSVLTNLAIKYGLPALSSEIRHYIECNYDYWYKRFGPNECPTYRLIDTWLEEKREELVKLI